MMARSIVDDDCGRARLLPSRAIRLGRSLALPATVLSAPAAHAALLAQTSLIWGASRWLYVALPLVGILLLLVIWGYWRVAAEARIRRIAATLKILGILILALCLLEPLFSSTRARPGANVFVVLADNSKSMTLRDRDTPQTRSAQFKALVARPSKWLDRIGQDFDLRQYAFDTQLRVSSDLDQIAFDGGASNMGAALQRLMHQYRGRPLAGIMVLTDGSATDADTIDNALKEASAAGHALPPIYPVLLGGAHAADDINLQQIAVSQTNFEDAPVTITAQLAASGFENKPIAAQLVDEAGKVLETQTVRIDRPGEPITIRFRMRPEESGVSFYRVRAALEGKTDQLDKPAEPSTEHPPAAQNPQDASEATLANNVRLVAVDRAKGPYRILYVAGRPNWEFKFLQRALSGDDQVQLAALLRIAKREPKFNYISHGDERSNPLFRGFKGEDEQTEQYDQPVMVRIGFNDESELRGGFPKAAEELYKFHAIVIDDLESEYFTQDQMQLVKEFVRDRGGGLLMLGGAESFKQGKYDRTPIGDLLPVYVDDLPAQLPDARYRMSLTREGWLEPWVRLRPEEPAENRRLETMPQFQVLNGVRGIKPGATVLATVSAEAAPALQTGLPGPGGAAPQDSAAAQTSGAPVPALVEQRFGKGRTAALLIGDMWRWQLRKPADAEDDQPKAWRQIIRRLVSEVPQRVEMAVEPRKSDDDPDGMLQLRVRVRDAAFAPQDNAAVSIKITTSDGKTVELPAEASSKEAGLYEAAYMPRLPGAYRAAATALAPDGSEIAKVSAGWTFDPAADEFRDLTPNRALLERIASATGGQIVAPADLETFAASLPTRHADITEPYIRPIWHTPWVFALAILCLTAEWGLRRWKGLP